jgi:prophage DNA circulation protein
VPWQDDLLPASFAHVPFMYENCALTGGRRGPDHEFPFRDDTYSEDLGEKKHEHKITGYVIGDDFMAQRVALVEVLTLPGPHTFVHPYLGPLVVMVRSWTANDDRADGRRTKFEFTFVEAGEQPSPTSQSDTSGDAIDAADDLDDDLDDAFSLAWDVSTGGLLTAATQMLGGLTGALDTLLSFPGLAIEGLAEIVGGLGGLVSDAVGLASAVTGLFGGYADACVLAIAVVDETTTSRGPDLSIDPSFGLMTFSQWGAGLPPNLAQSENGQALLALTGGACASALAKVYAQTDFPAQDDADAARDGLGGLIDDLSTSTGDVGDTSSFMALQRLYQATTNDLTVRAKQAPATITYALGSGTLPALSLAWMFYEDPSRAGDLVARNAAPHPLFVGPEVEVLSA